MSGNLLHGEGWVGWSMGQQLTRTISHSAKLRGLAFLAGVLILLGCGGGHAGPAQAQTAMPSVDTARVTKDHPELSWPIADKKLVIAHYMTGMIPAPEGEASHWMASDYYDPNGSTAAIGGIYQTLPVPMLLYPDGLPPIKQAALLEMRTAKALGVDGFNFYYPFGPDKAFRDRYDRFILSFFDAAKENDLDFKLTLCIAPYGGLDMTTQEKVQTLGSHLGSLIERSGHSDRWLKTPDGRYLIYTWLADAIVNEDLDGRHWEIRDRPELLHKAAGLYQQIAEVAGVQAAFLYHLDQPQDPVFVEKVLDSFPAVYGWCSVGEDLALWKRVAQQCRARGRTYIQEVHPDFYGSKVHPKDSYAMVHSPQRASAMGADQLERHAQVLGLTQTFRDKLTMAVELDSPLINFTSWNDYPEGHHLAPEINHNFGFSVLMKHYLAQWRGADGGPSDAVVVFFKKYSADIRPAPFDISIRNKKAVGEPGLDDGIEVITLLSEPGVLTVNGFPPRQVSAGMTVSRFLMEPGPVTAEVRRDDRVVTSLTTPEWITDEPFRTDRLTYSFSSEFSRIYEKVYGPDATKHTSQQYAQDEDGVPLWRRGVKTSYE